MRVIEEGLIARMQSIMLDTMVQLKIDRSETEHAAHSATSAQGAEEYMRKA